MHGKTFFLEKEKKVFEKRDKLCPRAAGAAGVALATEGRWQRRGEGLKIGRATRVVFGVFLPAGIAKLHGRGSPRLLFKAITGVESSRFHCRW